MTNKPDDTDGVHSIVVLMARMMNYLNVSLYEGLFTYKHEHARARLNEIYNRVSDTPFLAPTKEYSAEFYSNVDCLRRVTDTDDPDYTIYMFELRRYIDTRVESPNHRDEVQCEPSSSSSSSSSSNDEAEWLQNEIDVWTNEYI